MTPSVSTAGPVLGGFPSPATAVAASAGTRPLLALRPLPDQVTVMRQLSHAKNLSERWRNTPVGTQAVTSQLPTSPQNVRRLGFWQSTLHFFGMGKKEQQQVPETMLEAAVALDSAGVAGELFSKILMLVPKEDQREDLEKKFAALELELLTVDRGSAFELLKLMLTCIPEFKLRIFAPEKQDGQGQSDADQAREEIGRIEDCFATPSPQFIFYAQYLDCVGLLASALKEHGLDDQEGTDINAILEEKIDRLEGGESQIYDFATHMELIEELSPLLSDQQHLRYAAKLVRIGRHLPDHAVTRQRFQQIFDRELLNFDLGRYLLEVSRGTMVPTQGDAIGILDFVVSRTENVGGEALSHMLGGLAKYMAHENPIVRKNYRDYMQACFEQAKTKRAHVLLEVLKLLLGLSGDRKNIRKELQEFYQAMNRSMHEGEVAECLKTLTLLLLGRSPQDEVFKTALALVDKLSSPVCIEDWIESLSGQMPKDESSTEFSAWLSEMRALEMLFRYCEPHKTDWDHKVIKQKLAHKLRGPIVHVLVGDQKRWGPTRVLRTFFKELSGYFNPEAIQQFLPELARGMKQYAHFEERHELICSILGLLDSPGTLNRFISLLPNRFDDQSGLETPDFVAQHERIEETFLLLQNLEQQHASWDFTGLKIALAQKLGLSDSSARFANMSDTFWYGQLSGLVDVSGIFEGADEEQQKSKWNEAWQAAKKILSKIRVEYWIDHWNELKDLAQKGDFCALLALGAVSIPHDDFLKWREYLFSNIPGEYWISPQEFLKWIGTDGFSGIFCERLSLFVMTLFSSDDAEAKKQSAKHLDDWQKNTPIEEKRKMAKELSENAGEDIFLLLTLSFLHERGLGVKASRDSALDCVLKSYEIEPQNMAVITRLAWLSGDYYFQTGISETIADILKKHENIPTVRAALVMMVLYARIKVDKYPSEKILEDAGKTLFDVLGVEPNNALALFLKGYLCWQYDRYFNRLPSYENTQKYFMASIDQGYTMAAAWERVGELREKAERSEELYQAETRRCYLEALRCFPENSSLLSKLKDSWTDLRDGRKILQEAGLEDS